MNRSHRRFLTLATLILLLVFPQTVTAAEEPEFGGRTLTQWATMLKEDPVPRKRRAALVALGQIASQTADTETDRVIVVLLGKALRTDASEMVRHQAVVLLGQQRIEDAVGVLTDLVEAMRTEQDPAVRREVAAVLAGFGRVAKPAVLPLTQALQNKDASVRAAAANALGRIGADARSAAADLVALSRDPEKSVRLAAIFALGRIEPEDLEAPSYVLTQALGPKNDLDVRREALQSLRFLNDRSETVVRAIVGLLKDDDATLRREAVAVLARFGSSVRDVSIELLVALRTDDDKLVRVYLVRPVSTAFGGDPKRVIELLGNRLVGPDKDRDFEVRVAVCEELGSLGQAGKDALPILREARRDAEIKVRDAATRAIQQIEKPPAKPNE